jgi:polyhydroxybutyrate depolymerase
MDQRFWIGVALLAVITAGAASTAPAQDRRERIQKLRERVLTKRSQVSDPNESKITAPGDYRFSFVHDGLTREYIVHVPANLPKGRPAPMLLALHGGGGDMDYQAENYGLKQKADEAGFIAVFPNGYSRFPGGILATWNAGNCCGEARDKQADDVGFLKAVIERVSRQTSVDRDRVFATGMSNGALMTYRLACELPTMIRAIAPVAGTDNSKVCNPSRPVPVIHFHARDDTHVLFGGGAGKDAFRNREAVTDFTSVSATIEKWVALDHADPKPRRVLTVLGATCDLHPAEPRGTPVELCVTDTGGHSWPGTPARREGKNPSMAISANDLMWQFFQSL